MRTLFILVALHSSLLSGMGTDIYFRTYRSSQKQRADEEALLKAASTANFENYQIIKGLLNDNVNPNTQNSNGDTPLMRAVHSNFLEAAKLLLAKGADPNIQNKDGNTPLHVSIALTYPSIIKMLLNNGANTNIQNNDGNTPLHMVMLHLYHPKRMMQISASLLEHGANPNIENKQKHNPFYYAFNNKPDVALFLLRHSGLDVNKARQDVVQQFGSLENALRYNIITHNYYYLFQIALLLGANVNTPDEDGNTPLLHAINENRAFFVEKLLNAGADIFHKNNAGLSAWSVKDSPDITPEIRKMLVETQMKKNKAERTKR